MISVHAHGRRNGGGCCRRGGGTRQSGCRRVGHTLLLLGLGCCSLGTAGMAAADWCTLVKKELFDLRWCSIDAGDGAAVNWQRLVWHTLPLLLLHGLHSGRSYRWRSSYGKEHWWRRCRDRRRRERQVTRRSKHLPHRYCLYARESRGWELVGLCYRYSTGKKTPGRAGTHETDTHEPQVNQPQNQPHPPTHAPVSIPVPVKRDNLFFSHRPSASIARTVRDIREPPAPEGDHGPSCQGVGQLRVDPRRYRPPLLLLLIRRRHVKDPVACPV